MGKHQFPANGTMLHHRGIDHATGRRAESQQMSGAQRTVQGVCLHLGWYPFGKSFECGEYRFRDWLA